MKLLWGVGPHSHPLTESSGDGITLVWIPWLGGTRQGACLRCLHQGFGLRHLIEVLDLSSSSSSAIKNMKTQGWSQQPHPSPCQALSPSLCLSITHPIKIQPNQMGWRIQYINEPTILGSSIYWNYGLRARARRRVEPPTKLKELGTPSHSEIGVRTELKVQISWYPNRALTNIKNDIGWCPNQFERLNQLISQPRINKHKEWHRLVSQPSWKIKSAGIPTTH